MKKYLTIDRIFFVVFVIFWAFLVWNVIKDWSNETGLVPWIVSLLWVIILALWALLGFRKIEIGHKGQLLFLGQRMNFFFEEEGAHWVPFPLGIKIHDCREQIMELDVLEAITSDNVKVFINTTITYKVVNLQKRADVQDTEIKHGIDDARDQILRVEVANTPLNKVLKMHEDLGKKMHLGLQKSSERWGIEIIEVIITKVITDPEVAEDLELKVREKLQKKGQKVEAKFSIELVKLFEKSIANGGGGLTHGEAVEMMQLTTGKAAAKNLSGFTFSPEILKAIAEIVGRK